MEKEEIEEVIKEKGNGKKKNRGKAFETILGVVFLTWFIASIIGMMIFSAINISVAVILFGQYFFIFSMIAFSNRDIGLMPLIHLTVGIIVMLAPFVIKIFPRFSDLSTKDYINYSIPIASILLGYFFLVTSRFKKDKKEFRIIYVFAWIFFLIGMFTTVQFCL